MKKILFVCLILFGFMNQMKAQMDIPIIDREVFFGNPEISSGQLSPDGTYVSFMAEHNGIMNIWVKKFDQEFAEAKLLTSSSSPILGYFWTDDSKYILYGNDEGGDENMNIFAVDPSAEADGDAPVSRNLTPMEEVTAQIYQVSKNDPDKLILGINDRDKAWHDLYELTISTGDLKLLFENTNRYTGWDFDWDENLRIAYRTDEDGNSQILRVEEDGSFEEIYTTNLQEQAYINGWTPDNQECYLITNKGDINFSTLYKMNPSTGELEYVESDPKKQADFGGLFIDENTREILYTSYTHDKRVRNWKNAKWEKMYTGLQGKFPGKEVGFVSFTKDNSKMLLSVWGDNKATEVYFYDWANNDLIHQYTPRPKLKEVEKHLSTMTPVRYKSSDGMEIPAYLSLPVGVEAQNLPVVMFIHGGPKGPRDNWGFNGRVQLLTNRGYAVLQPNFRASGGYGKEFLNAGDKEWGKKMQDDITWGVKYLVDKGIADPERIAIMGGSYGGYATLAGLAFTPDVYACGIDIVGPSNLFTLLESIPPYWEAGRKWLHEMVGDPDTEEGQKLLKEASPLFSADKISKPLLIVQGANDPRVKKAESDQIVIALRDKGQPVEYILAEDEGHGFRKPNNRQAMWAESEKFLAKHIGGRYQKDVPVEIQETIETLSVDITSVKLAEAPKVEVMSAYPSLAIDASEGTTEYDVVLKVQGQEVPMTMTRTISKEGGHTIVKDAVQSPMGPMEDVAKFDADFKPVERMVTQGGQTIIMAISGTTAEIDMAGKKMPLEADGIFMVDGPGVDMVLAAMDMTEGHETSYYHIDMMTMKAKQVVATVMGTEEINGTPTRIVEVRAVENENDKTTLYIDPVQKIALKMVQVIPAMGNAEMIMIRK